MATWGNMSLQDSNSPLMEELLFFHDYTMLVLLLITISIGFNMSSLFFYKTSCKFMLMGHWLEVIWTAIPLTVLVFVAFPSLRLLYLCEEIWKPCLSIKAIGHQWYWSYEYSDFNPQVEFDSYMIPYNNMNKNMFRLLDVDNRIVMPTEAYIRVMVTSLDVLHSWTIPCLGVKTDATPGRLNQVNIYLNRSGLFYGQCSEICGANHSFMPIVLESVPPYNFYQWIYHYND